MAARPSSISFVPLAQLNLWPRNYRKGEVAEIAGSLKRFGFNGALRVREQTVYAGNHTLLALRTLKQEGTEPPNGIEVSRSGEWLVPCRDIGHLSEQEATAFALADNRTAQLGDEDGTRLAEILTELRSTSTLEGTGYKDSDLDQILADLAGQGVDPNKYVRSVVAPIYEIKGEQPKVEDLVDHTKTIALCSAIYEAGLDHATEQFLRAAATRHNVFNYENIAEFYAHAEPKVQRLMEQSALVIIDFGKAIENGFVELTSELAGAYNAEQDPDAED